MAEISGNLDRYAAPCGLTYGLNHDVELAVKVTEDACVETFVELVVLYGSTADRLYGNLGKDEYC